MEKNLFLRQWLLICFIQAALSFTCLDLNTQDACTTVPGCQWTSEACSGTISCSPPDCYFVDPAYVGESSGAAAQPYTELVTPLNAMVQASTLYIYNPVPGLVLPAGTGKTISVEITIRYIESIWSSLLEEFGIIIL